ncbi:MAG: TonB-dependent receptor [Erythrobacter sp.]
MTNATIRSALMAATVLTPAFALPHAALAQSEDTEEPAVEDAATAEIVITARKTAESINDAPIAVTAFDAEGLEDREIRDASGLANFVPGLSFSQSFGRSGDRPIIRGLSNVLAGVQFGVESGVSVFLDGALFRGDIQTINFDAIERIEVVKGPQSALYGRNTYAGAINIVTQTPGNDFGGFAKGRIAEDDEYEVTAGIDVPVVPDLLALRFDGRYYTYGGQYENQLTGETIGDEESYGGAVTAFFTPTPDIDWRVRAQYTEDRDGPVPFFLQPAIDNNCQPGFRSPRYRTGGSRVSDNPNQYFCGVIRPRPELVALNTDPLADGTPDGTAFDGIAVDRLFISTNIDWDIGGSGWVLTAIGAYRDEIQKFGSDSDFSDAYVVFGPPGSVEPLFANTDIEEFEDYSIEVRLASPEDLPVRGLIGGYYYDFEEKGRDITFASGTDGVDFGTVGAGNDRSTIENIAVFGRVEGDIGPTLTVGLEGRYFEETKTLLEFNVEGGTLYPEYKISEFNPRVTVDWQPSFDTLVYGIYAEGTKPGGINGANGIVANSPTFLDEKLKGGELGVKQTFLEGALQVNAAAYYNELTDVQLTTSIPDTTGTTAVTSIATNQGNAEVLGFELELQIRPSEYLSFSASYAYVDAAFTSGCDDFEYTLNTGGLLANFDTRNPTPEQLELCSIEGNRLPLGSPHQISTSAFLDYPITTDLDLVGSLAFSFEDSKFVQVHNLAKTGTTELLNARLGVQGDNWEVSLFGRNLTDEDTIPLATRWFDLRHGFAPRDIPFGQLAAQGRAADTGLPRAFFAALRRGRQLGVEVSFNF